jgi:hypothetical protein
MAFFARWKHLAVPLVMLVSVFMFVFWYKPQIDTSNTLEAESFSWLWLLGIGSIGLVGFLLTLWLLRRYWGVVVGSITKRTMLILSGLILVVGWLAYVYGAPEVEMALVALSELWDVVQKQYTEVVVNGGLEPGSLAWILPWLLIPVVTVLAYYTSHEPRGPFGDTGYKDKGNAIRVGIIFTFAVLLWQAVIGLTHLDKVRG